MKIFISYGHEDHTQVVDLLFDALIREGHEPWKDDRYEGNSGIPAGQDFTELIYRTIDASDFVIAFVTAQTKDKPYCRDERQRAYNSKGNHFIQIRMDYADITLGNARSYIDMSDVVGGNGQVNERLFADKLKALLAAFRDPASFAEGGFTPWAKFDTHLKVPGALKYRDFIASLDGDDFVGRQWLLEKCKNWALSNDIPCRLFVILGEAGTGKTAFIRRLASDEELVRSVHICVYDKPSTRTARDTLKDLAYVLAQNNSRYFEFLKMRDFEQLRDMTLDGLFEFLFIEPLKTETQKFLLVIDALDEMEETTGFKPLMKLFRQYAQQLNPNISFLVTGRPDAYITDMLKTVAQGKPLESVLLDKNVSKEDLESFIRRKLDQLGCYSQGLADKLLEACDGNFEYLSLLFREALEEGLPVFEGMKIPRGLNERYAQYLDRRMEMADCNRLSKAQRQLLSVLCAAYEPLPISVLCAVTGLEDYDVTDELELFGSLIRHIGAPGEELRICLFTKSFRDFLLSRAFDKYFADHKLGTRLLAQYLIHKCGAEKALKKYTYLDQYGFVHLLQYAAEEPEEVTDYCKALADSGTDIAQRIAGALHLGGPVTIRSYWKVRKAIGLNPAVIGLLKGRRSVEALSEFIAIRRENDDPAGALILEADMLLWHPSPEAYRQAEEYYLQILEISEKAHNENPTFQTRRDLAVSYNRLGDLEESQKTAEGNIRAEQWFRKALEIDEVNYRTEPNYQSRRDMAISYNRLGDLIRRNHTKESDAQAEQWYRQALELYQQNYSDQPSYESRRGLAITYGRLGELARSKRTAEGDAQAEQWFLKVLELYQLNHSLNPCYQSRRDLSINYNRLGDLMVRRQTAAADEQAEQWFLKALEMDEQNHHESPSYESRRDLSIIYNRLGRLVQHKGTPEGSAQAEQWFRKALEMDEENHNANPSYESRRDLSVSYCYLGDLALLQHTKEGNAQAEQWFLKALAMDEENYSINPCQETRRDLSVDYNRLGDLSRNKGTQEGLDQAEQWYLKMLELDGENYQNNPSYESRRDLSVTYNRLGDVARNKGTPEGLEQAIQWYLKSMALDEENYSISPTPEIRRDLAIAYLRLGDIDWNKGTEESAAEAEQWYLKMLKLLEENHQYNPCAQSKRDLSVVYHRLRALALAKGTKEGYEEANIWQKRNIKLQLF